MPKYVARCSANSPVSSKVPGSSSASIRSRAVSLPCVALLLLPVLAAALAITSAAALSSAIRSSIEAVWCLGLLPSVPLRPVRP